MLQFLGVLGKYRTALVYMSFGVHVVDMGLLFLLGPWRIRSNFLIGIAIPRNIVEQSITIGVSEFTANDA